MGSPGVSNERFDPSPLWATTSTLRTSKAAPDLDAGRSAEFAAAVVRRHQTSWRLWQWTRRFGWSLHCRVLRPFPAACKRSLDVVLALGIGIALSPIVLLLGVACRLTQGQWLRAEAVTGRYGQTFQLCEFPIPDNQWGRCVRYLGLHHIPVLWHVLTGEMAWVGPRPLPKDTPRDSSFQRRAADRPGVVCLWWIRQQANIDFDSEKDSDHEYIESASLRSDLGIACRAVWIRLLGGRRSDTPPSAKIHVLDVPVRNVTMDRAVDELVELMESELMESDEIPATDLPRQATFVNADCINQSRKHSRYRRLLQEVDWNYADGIGMKLAAQLQRASVRQNVNGTDLFPRLLTRMEESRLGVYLLGGEPMVAADTAAWIRQHHPGVVVCGAADGFFREEESQSRIDEINESGADLLLVAMGAPRQDLWIQDHLHQLDVRVAMGVGGLFDFYSGRKRRAPQWVREMGMEWCYRLMLEPARLWRRYLVGNGAFLARVGVDAIRKRLTHRQTPLPFAEKPELPGQNNPPCQEPPK